MLSVVVCERCDSLFICMLGYFIISWSSVSFTLLARSVIRSSLISAPVPFKV